MPWAYALSVCFGCIIGRLFWAYVLGLCFGRKLWAYALSVCFKCMALEGMALSASLWVGGFGCMSLGIWILPKKPEAKN